MTFSSHEKIYTLAKLMASFKLPSLEKPGTPLMKTQSKSYDILLKNFKVFTLSTYL